MNGPQPNCQPAAPGRLVLVDFDGTITERDVDFVIAESVLGPQRSSAYLPLVAAYERLDLGLEEYFRRLLELLAISPDELAGHLGAVSLRPDFGALLQWCTAAGVPLEVASEGLDLYIRPVLHAAGFGSLPLSCNHVRRDAGGYRIEPPADGEPCDRCLNCKGVRVRRAQRAGRQVAIIGDGASDLCAARVADRVFARSQLQDHCRREGIAYQPWERFADVVAGLRDW